MALRACDGCGPHAPAKEDPLSTYYPGEELADEAGRSPERATSRPLERSPSSAGSPRSLATGPLSTVPLSTAAADQSFQDDAPADGSPSSPLRLRYIGKAALVMLQEKLKRGQEVGQEELIRLAAPDQLPDSEMLVPVHLDSTWSGGVEAALRNHGGARAAAISLVAARERCEATVGAEPITAKEWRALAREADGVLKPLLLAFIALTALGSGALLATTRDASRRFFLLLALPHVGPEVLLLTFLLFGPKPNGDDPRWKPRLAARLAYVASVAAVASAPLGADGWAGPAALAALLAVAALADGVCLWLGALFWLQRVDAASRRLGAALLAHGLAGQLAAAEFFRPGLFGGEGAGKELLGWGWVLMCLATALAMLLLVPIFRMHHFDMRAHHPSATAAGYVVALAFATVLCQPLLAGALPDIRRQPSFLPRGDLLAAYKIAASTGGLLLAFYAVTEYNLARQRPLPPALATFVGSTIWRSLHWVD